MIAGDAAKTSISSGMRSRDLVFIVNTVQHEQSKIYREKGEQQRAFITDQHGKMSSELI